MHKNVFETRANPSSQSTGLLQELRQSKESTLGGIHMNTYHTRTHHRQWLHLEQARPSMGSGRVPWKGRVIVATASGTGDTGDGATKIFISMTLLQIPFST